VNKKIFQYQENNIKIQNTAHILKEFENIEECGNISSKLEIE
jgi:hypothetical protein